MTTSAEFDCLRLLKKLQALDPTESEWATELYKDTHNNKVLPRLRRQHNLMRPWVARNEKLMLDGKWEEVENKHPKEAEFHVLEQEVSGCWELLRGLLAKALKEREALKNKQEFIKALERRRASL